MSADVCVVGGGISGIAVALRAAKLGHRVVLIEAADAVGGSLRPVRVGDRTLDDGRADMLLPAALRDMFRKTGRPLERELGLATVDGSRRFWAGDHTTQPALELPLLGRGAQHQAVAATFGEGSGRAWTAALDACGGRWDATRGIVENDLEPALKSIGARRLRRLGFPHRFPSDFRLLSRVAGADVLAAAAGYPLVRDGHVPVRVPAVLSALPYLEQNLGRWHPDGGARGLLDVLSRRLELRGVEVVTACPVLDLTGGATGVTGVRTAEGTQRADVVVTAVGPTELARLTADLAPALARRLRRVQPMPIRRTTFVRVDREIAPDGYENVLLGDPVVTVRSVPPDVTGDVGDLDTRWLVLESWGPDVDLLATAAARGLDLQPGLLERHRIRPSASSGGVRLAGWRTFGRLAPVASDVDGRLPEGLLVAGHASYLPAGLPTELLSAALAAAALPTSPGSADPKTFP